jgi:hypothetical protein
MNDFITGSDVAVVLVSLTKCTFDGPNVANFPIVDAQDSLHYSTITLVASAALKVKSKRNRWRLSPKCWRVDMLSRVLP